MEGEVVIQLLSQGTPIKLQIWNDHGQVSPGSFMKFTIRASLVAQMIICQQCRRHRFNPWVGKIPWRKKWLPTPVFLPGKFHRQQSLAAYSLWDHKELDTTEQLTFSVSIYNQHVLHKACQYPHTLAHPLASSPKGDLWLPFLGAWCWAGLLRCTASFVFNVKNDLQVVRTHWEGASQERQ